MGHGIRARVGEGLVVMAVTNLRGELAGRRLIPTVQADAHEENRGSTPTLLSRRRLQLALGALWFLDGALQVFPPMWTSHLSDDVMKPVLSGQPGLITASVQPGITLASQHIMLTNALIMIVQIALGVGLLLGVRVREVLIASVVWSLIVWVGGEGFGMLLTGQAGAFTGAPGAVLLYAFLALAALPGKTCVRESVPARTVQKGLALLWGLFAVLQLQPYWWQPGQIVFTVSANKQPGTLSGVLLDGSIGWAAGLVGQAEPAVNIVFIAIALLLAIGLFVGGPEKARSLLVVSMIVSLAMWWGTQGFGLILTGGATDVNSGLLLVLCALACWPRRERRAQSVEPMGLSAQQA